MQFRMQFRFLLCLMRRVYTRRRFVASLRVTRMERDYTIALLAAHQAHAISAFRHVREQKPQYIIVASLPFLPLSLSIMNTARSENRARYKKITGTYKRRNVSFTLFFAEWYMEHNRFFSSIFLSRSLMYNFFFFFVSSSTEMTTDSKHSRTYHSHCHCFFSRIALSGACISRRRIDACFASSQKNTTE